MTVFFALLRLQDVGDLKLSDKHQLDILYSTGTAGKAT